MTTARVRQPARILVVEDNADLAYGLRTNLEVEGYLVEVAPTGMKGLRALTGGHPPDLVILDLMLPDLDGVTVLKRARAMDCEAPVLILTARGEEADKVHGLRAGADDYVTKPFGLLELLARVEALLRRGRHTTDAEQRTVRFGDVEIDRDRRQVSKAGTKVALAPKELDLLLALAIREGAVASRVELLREVWGYDQRVVSRTVDTHIAELRRKLEDEPAHPRHIVTVRKAGYRLETTARRGNRG